MGTYVEREDYTLEQPVTTKSGEEVQVVTLRQLSYKQFKLVQRKKDDMERAEYMLAFMTGLAPDDIGEMCLHDIGELQTRAARFLPGNE